MNKKLLISIGIFALWSIICVVATWFIFANQTAQINVVSQQGNVIYFEQAFPLTTLNTNTSADTKNTTANIINKNSLLLNLTFNSTITKTATDNNCTNLNGDCNFSYYLNNNPILNGQKINLSSGSNPFVISTTCMALSCPANMTANISISQ